MDAGSNHILFCNSGLVTFFAAQHELPTPSFRKTISKGQNLVNEDCRRLSPTNAVNQSQYGLW